MLHAAELQDADGEAKDDGGYYFTRGRPSLPRGFHEPVRGRIFTDVAITTSLAAYGEIRAGGSAGDGLRAATSAIASPDFLLGDIGGGLLGATLGSMIPLPAALSSAGFAGAVISRFPVMLGALLFASLGAAAVRGFREGGFSFGDVFSTMDPSLVLLQALGSSLGASFATLFISSPYLAVVLGGVAGGILFTKLCRWGRAEPRSADSSSVPSSLSSSSSSLPSEAVPAPSSSTSADAPKGGHFATSSDDLADLAELCCAQYRGFMAAAGPVERAASWQAYVEVRSRYETALRFLR